MAGGAAAALSAGAVLNAGSSTFRHQGFRRRLWPVTDFHRGSPRSQLDVSSMSAKCPLDISWMSAFYTLPCALTLPMRLLLTWFINAAALFAVPYLMHSISVDSVGAALVAALLLGLVNTLIRPVLLVLTLPVTVLSLGLFIFVVNGLLFWLVSQLVSGFHVTGFLAAIGGALLYSVISWALSTLLLKNDDNA
jgi:putative membrane protein